MSLKELTELQGRLLSLFCFRGAVLGVLEEAVHGKNVACFFDPLVVKTCPLCEGNSYRIRGIFEYRQEGEIEVGAEDFSPVMEVTEAMALSDVSMEEAIAELQKKVSIPYGLDEEIMRERRED